MWYNTDVDLSTFFFGGYKMKDEMIERFEQFTYATNVIYRSIIKLERDEMEKYGYRASYALYLAIISGFPEGLTATKLSELSDRDKAGISRIVSEMEEKGLIKRQCSRDNFYRARLTLTDKGKEIAKHVQKKAIAAVIEAGGGISDEDRRVFYECLGLIASNLKKISAEGLGDGGSDEC